MITIISATNRVGSNTKKVSNQYLKIIELLGKKAQVLDLEWLQKTTRDEEFTKIENEILAPTEKFIIVCPEYNGGVPGIFKLLIDIGDRKKVWVNKKAMLVGVASGRAGNLRGLDHLTNMLHYMGTNVYSVKLPISSIDKELDANAQFVNPLTIETVTEQIKGYLAY